MAEVAFRIPDVSPSTPGTTHNLRVRARTMDGRAGESTPIIPFRTVRRSKQRRIRHNNKWVDVGDYAVANILEQALVRSFRDENQVVSQATRLVQLSSEVGNKAAATVVDALNTRVIDNENFLLTEAEKITELRSDLGNYATAIALEALTTRVVETEMGITASSSRITALMSEVAGKARATALEALTTRVTTAEGRITAESQHIVELMSEIAGKASSLAVQTLTTRVTEDEGNLNALSSSVTQLRASLAGYATAQALQVLEAEVDSNTGSLARWLVKLQVGDLVGSIGLVNDGGTIRFYVQADRFVVLPTANSGVDARIPFAVENGKVWIDEALIRDAVIAERMIVAGGMNGDVVIQNGTLSGNKVRANSLDVLNAQVGRELRSTNFVSGISGWRFGRTGAAQLPAANILGRLSAAQIQLTGALQAVGSAVGIGPGGILEPMLANAAVGTTKVASRAITDGDTGSSILTLTGTAGARYVVWFSGRVDPPPGDGVQQTR